MNNVIVLDKYRHEDNITESITTDDYLEIVRTITIRQIIKNKTNSVYTESLTNITENIISEKDVNSILYETENKL